MGQIPLANGFYQSESLPLSNQACINLYPHIPEVPSLSDEVLLGTPGISELTTTGTILQANRGAWTKQGIPYVVNGDTLYSVDRAIDAAGVETFSYTSLGSVEGTGRVSLSSNPTQLMILVPGGKGYIYDESAGTPFQEIVDADFTANGNPTHVVFIDGLFVCTTDENKIIHSDTNDGMSWKALDFGAVESDPDAVVSPVVVNNQLFVTGTVTMEGFQNIGGSGFSFQRNNVFLDKGCSAPFSIVKTNQSFFMIGQGENEGPAIWQFEGNFFQKISTAAIDAELQTISELELSESFSLYYGIKGHYFVNFTVAEKTFTYDLVTKRWHERQSYVLNERTKWRVASLVSAYERIIVADTQDGRIGELSSSEYAEYDADIVSEFSIQPFFNVDGASLPCLELTMESGVGNDYVEDPTVSLSISKEGKTFGSERIRSLGKLGEYFRRLVWRRNGRVSRMGVLKFRISDRVKRVFIRLDAK